MTNIAAALDATRTDDEIAYEAVANFIAVYFTKNSHLDAEREQYHASQDAMKTLAGNDPETEAYLLLVDARQWYRSLVGREWED